MFGRRYTIIGPMPFLCIKIFLLPPVKFCQGQNKVVVNVSFTCPFRKRGVSADTDIITILRIGTSHGSM